MKNKETIGFNMVGIRFSRFTMLLFLSMIISSFVWVNIAYAAGEPVCAEVKIEIKQELTLERQGFDARMKINNDLDSIPLENVTIRVNFSDRDGNTVVATSDPNATDAKFFIRIDSMDGIDSIEGGTLPAKTTADIHWLIVPVPGAAEGSANGVLYFVGAELSYTVGGELEEVTVAPDFIRVKPMPEITLDYFLTRFTKGDDPLTEEIEAIEPFTLGVRVQNNGSGLAKNLKIESAQPKIVENDQGLLIDFKIIGSTLNDQPSTPSLLMNFGDIESGESSMGRWLMETTLAGEFTEFTASFTHAEEFGGELTSLITATNTHFLEHDVLVDLPGRDGVRDFLVDFYNEYKVYESNNVDTVVDNQSADATLSFSQQLGTDSVYTLSATATDGFSFIKLEDTFTGSKVIKQVIRSDGKVLKTDNAWFSKERAGSGVYNYRFNLFDVRSTGSYSVVLTDKVDVPLAPNMQFIPDRTTHEGKSISFLIEASDPNGTIPVLTALNLPTGASLQEQGNGKAIFAWTPAEGQARKHEITYVASDGVLSNSRKAFITVNPANDTDGDGMDDAWEMEHFGTLDRDGTGDFDGDGISDLDEFKQDTDPNIPNVVNFVLDNASVDSDWQTINMGAFTNPVIIAGVPSDNEADSAIVRLRTIKSDSFKIRLQEWAYQDGIHALESVPYMVLEAGRHTMSDGSIWEVGTFDVISEQRWQKHNFIQEYMSKPQVYLTIQTNNDSDSVVVRIKDITKTGFEAALFEEEANSGHSRELVGYVAIYAPDNSGSINISDNDYSFSSEILPINNEGSLLADGVTTLRLEEEQSQDDEVLHEHEDVAVLSLGNAVFAQDTSTKYTDTISLRKNVNVATTATPLISPKGGLISQATMVTLASTTVGAQIYYTLNGTTPDPVNNVSATQLYVTPIAITATTVLKVIAKLDGIEDSLENTTTYTFVANTPPMFIAIPDRTVSEGHSLSFVVQALDQNTLAQGALTVDLAGLAGSPVFVDNGDGTGRFSWIPPSGSANDTGYTLSFVATDAQDSSLTATTSMKIIVTDSSVVDSDSDGMPDYWELQYSFDPNDPADADGDADLDGISNIDEYQQGRNPLIADVIVENILPIAVIDADFTSGTAPLAVQFSGATSTDDDGSIVGYEWATSDGGSGSDATFNYTFETEGDYTVSLTVTDNSGGVNTKTISISVTASTSVIYEDAENGNTDGWRVYDATPAGATISNVFDADKASQVIALQGTGTQNGYILGDFENRAGAWNDTQNKKIRWSMKYDESFTVFIRVMTSNGSRYIYYTASDTDRGLSGKYIHYGLGADVNNGTWRTFTRDLEADLKNIESDNELLAVNAFLIRGSGYVDDVELGSNIDVPDTTAPAITLNGEAIIDVVQGVQYVDAGATAVDYIDGVVSVSTTGVVDTAVSGFNTIIYTAVDSSGNTASVSRTVRVISVDGSIVYEDAENGNTEGWRVYDQTPEGATISNVIDDEKISKVIELLGGATQNGYMLGNIENRAGAWNDTQNKKIRWSMKYDEAFTVFIRVMTTNGARYIYYTASDADKGLHSNGTYIHYGLGADASDGTWRTFTRDLEADLKNIESDNELLAVNAFLIRGSGRVDDIELGAFDVPDTTVPQITLIGESIVDVVLGDDYFDAGATAVDYIDGVISVVTTGIVDTSVSGFNNIVYAATDAAGNKATVSRTVRVVSADGSIVYENAEDGNTIGWRVYDQTPTGAVISNVYDVDKASQVIELIGDKTRNGYILGNFENRVGAWNDTQNKKIRWSMKYDEYFTVFIRVMTSNGSRYIYYTASDIDRGLSANGHYIHYGLGATAKDGTWQTFTRDLEADLKAVESDNELLAVNAFLIRGSGRIDDVTLTPSILIAQ